MTETVPSTALGFRLRRILGVLFAVGLGVLVVAWLGGRWWVTRYLQSEQFRKLISQQTSSALRAKGEFLPLHWSGNTAYCDGFFARGLPESTVQEVRVDQIRAVVDVAGLFRRSWRVHDLEIQRLQATLQSPAPGPTSPAQQIHRGDIGPIRIQEVNLSWPMGENASGSVRRVQAVIELADAGWQASGSGGELMVRDWRVMKLGPFRLRSQGETLFIAESRLELADGGRLNVSGEVRAGSHELSVRFSDVPVANWLPVDWRGRLTGQANGESMVHGLTAEGTITLTDAQLEALPVLDQIATFTSTAQFRRMSLSKARAEYVWQPERLTIRQVQLESPGLLRVEGGCVVEHGTVDGEFDVGVAARPLQWLPGARTRVFTVDRDGYLWTKVRVRGPLKNLQEEDLSSRLIAAAGTEVIEDATDIIKSGAQEFFDLLRKIEP